MYEGRGGGYGTETGGREARGDPLGRFPDGMRDVGEGEGGGEEGRAPRRAGGMRGAP